jgi:hypothetical protein
MKESAILVISNLRKTILIFILILLIGARIILNLVLVLLIPMLLVLLTGWYATQFFHTVGIVIIGLLGFGIIIMSSYLMGLFNVFSTAVWVLTYGALIEHRNPSIKDEEI